MARVLVRPLVAPCAAAALLTSACGLHAPRAFEEDGSAELVYAYDVDPGERVFFGYLMPEVISDSPVVLTDARMVGVPDGLTIKRVHVLDFEENDPGGTLMLARSEHVDQFDLSPFDPRVLDSGGPPGSRFQLVIEARLERPGDFVAEGLRLSYEIDGRGGEQEFDYRIQLCSDAKGCREVNLREE